jgi:3-deoxy-D-manno-octulosonic-acid transferase
MKWTVYNILFLLAYPFLLPGFLLRMLRRGGYAARFGDRFALYPEEILRKLGRLDALSDSHAPSASQFVWIHAVSVGEVQVAGQLMREWRKAEPSVRFCFSTTSSTGWKMAEREITPSDVLIYNPLDFPTFVRAALQTVRPRAMVLVESEIWPNFIRRAAKEKVPVFLINARVSDRSAPRYRAAKCFFKDIFSIFTRIFAQSALDRDRLVAAGAPEDIVDVTGSFKFDVAHRAIEKESEIDAWIDASLAPAKRGKIILGGSTWPGEDEALLKIYRAIFDAHKGEEDAPTLIIAPRHFEKADAVEENIRRARFQCVRRSRKGAPPTGEGDARVLLADTTGELMALYALADIVFVGKSLCAHGSQNMIEPCLCGKPTVVGPFTENFRPVMSDLLAADALVQVASEKELAEKITSLYNDPAECEALGARAAKAVEARCGVVQRCVAAILEELK